MHIPDGFLTTPVAASTGILSATVLIRTVRQVNRSVRPEEIPLMGILASFVFMLQLFSFPVMGGTSVHLNGALLVSIVLGPAEGFIIMSVALLALALLFQHGGIFSLGANILNMAMVGCFVAHWLYRILPGKRVAIVGAVFLASLFSALLCAGELSLSHMLVFGSAAPTMLLIYGVAGLLEGIATWLILDFIHKVKPELLRNHQ